MAATDPDLHDRLRGVRDELASAAALVERVQEDHRRLESVLDAVLEHVPAAVLVVDSELRISAVSRQAQERWGSQVGRTMPTGDRTLAALRRRCRAILDTGEDEGANGDGDGRDADLMLIDDDDRYVVIVGT